MTYTPDYWVKLKISRTGLTPVFRILAGWVGGWANSDSWQLNSGIVAVHETEYLYCFVGETGNEYICHKDSQRMSAYLSGILEVLKSELSSETTIEVVRHT